MHRLLSLLLVVAMSPAAEPAVATALRRNPLRSRPDLAQAMRDLYEPVRAHRVPGGLDLGPMLGFHLERTARCEAQLRPLWGLASLVQGGGGFAHWDEVRQALIEGTTPDGPGDWGRMTAMDQRMVEMAPLALGLLIASQELWDPLTPEQRTRVLDWLAGCDAGRKELKSNWAFFRVLAHLALRRHGRTYDEALHAQDLANIDACYLGDGWYSDGPTSRRDYYIPMAMHYYGLVYARLMADEDPERCARFRQRAGVFAADFMHWFTPRGEALPFGRSLTYRFAQGAFWGALAYADVVPPGMTRGQVKGLLLRHLRWWFQQPIFTADGLLSVGYCFPNHDMSELYNAPGSPYWATKTFIALALPEDGPFWTAPEEALPTRPVVSVQPHAGFVVTHDDARNLTVALAGGQDANWMPLDAANKYGKCAYSTAFPFCANGGHPGPAGSGQDSTLSLSDDTLRFRGRETCVAQRIMGTIHATRWKPWPDVTVETWLAPLGTAHVRLHHVVTARTLTAAEAGFTVPRSDLTIGTNQRHESLVVDPRAGASLVVDLTGQGAPETPWTFPGLNLGAAVTMMPVCKRSLAPGEHWLAAAVAALPGSDVEPVVRAQLQGLQWRPPTQDQPAAIVAADGAPVVTAMPIPDGNPLEPTDSVRR